MPTTQKKKGYLVAKRKMMTMNVPSPNDGAVLQGKLYVVNGHEAVYP